MTYLLVSQLSLQLQKFKAFSKIVGQTWGQKCLGYVLNILYINDIQWLSIDIYCIFQTWRNESKQPLRCIWYDVCTWIVDGQNPASLWIVKYDIYLLNWCRSWFMNSMDSMDEILRPSDWCFHIFHDFRFARYLQICPFFRISDSSKSIQIIGQRQVTGISPDLDRKAARGALSSRFCFVPRGKSAWSSRHDTKQKNMHFSVFFWLRKGKDMALEPWWWRSLVN